MDLLVVSLVASSVLAPSVLEALHPYYIALRHLKAGRFRQALPHLARSIEWQLHRDECYLLRAFAHIELGETEAALANYNRLLELRPRNAMAMLGRGKLYQEQGQVDLALRDYDDAVGVVPREPQVYHVRAMARLYMGFSTAAADDVQNYLRLAGWGSPTSAFAAVIGILAYRQAQQADASNRLLSEAWSRLGSEAWPKPLLSYLHGSLSADDLMRVAGSPQEVVHAHATVGLNLSYSGQSAAALPYLQWIETHGTRERGDQAWSIAIRELERLRGR